ncbi:hypothetical protein GCM10017559_45070 [Streptosporangium longisporum]|uniref:Uncharacterized protein n=1 Tax=Streptosporangium longisporum TaxID=46187 RepID=A0ABN3Y385_9ACTN
MAARHPQEHREEQQFIHLVRLAWDLHERGMRASVELPVGGEPVLLVSPSLPLFSTRVMAVRRGRDWWFTWGRDAKQSVPALAPHAADLIREVAQ